MRKIALALLAALSFMLPAASAFGQACPAVAALPDSERRIAYAPSASTGPFSVTFALYGDSTDYGSWVEVWLNGVRLTPVTDWQLTIPSGSLSTACRPITNASITLTNAATGTLQIVGARRARRTTQFGQTVPARDLNVAISDLTAQLRELWDKTNDVTGRALIGPPGDTVLPMPPAADRASRFLHFDATGTIPQMLAGGAGSGNVVGPATSTIGHFATWADTTGTLLADSGTINLNVAQGGTGGSSWTANLPLIGNGAGPLIQGTVSGNTTKFATTFGALTTDQCVKVDASGNFVVAGATCGASANAPNKQYFATPSGTTITLTSLPLPTSADLLDIYFDGVLQDRNTWSLVVGTGVVTFAAAIPANVQQASAYWFAPSTLSGIGSITVGASTLTGAINLLAGTGISLTPVGQNITVNAAVAPPGGRLTLQQHQPVQNADQAAKSTIYYDCHASPNVPIPNGSAFANYAIPSCEISVGLSTSHVLAAGAAFTASIAGSVLTVTAISSGTIMVNQNLIGSGVLNGLAIASLGTGTGGTGTYNLTGTQTLSGRSMSTSGFNAYDVFITTVAGVPTPCYNDSFWTTGSQSGVTVTHGANTIHNTLGYWTNLSSVTNCWSGAAGNTNLGPLSTDTALYAGSFLATANGQTSMVVRPAAATGGNNTVCGLFNAYNQEPFSCKSQDLTAEWSTTSTGAAVACNAAAATAGLSNRVNFVDGLGIKRWTATYSTSVVGAAPSPDFASTVEVGLNNGITSTGAGGGGQLVQQIGAADPNNNFGFGIMAVYNPYPTIGANYIQCLEGGANSHYFGNDFMMLWLDIHM